MNLTIDENVKTNGAAGDGMADGCYSVLLVDDEARILSSLHRLLHEKYHVEQTESPEHALELLAREEFALVITDQRMPDMEGTELCALASEIAPDTKRVILTGYSDMKAAMDAINRGSVYRFMLKPWRDDEMSALVDEAVKHYNLAEENRRLNALTVRQNLELQELNKRLEGFNGKLQEKVFERTREISELSEKVTRYFRGSIDLLSRLSAMHSQVLGNHGRRVAELSVKIGQQQRLSEKDLSELEIAATLHDIGKIGMDPRVVSSSGEQTERERAVLRTHPVEGAGLIARIPGLSDVGRLVRHHHEAYNGDGFPDRLRGDAIPVGSRIIAVADAFDNFLNMRSRYTEAEAKAAITHLEQRSGSQFDPAIVQVLASLLTSDRIDIPESYEVEIALRELRPGMVLSRDLVTAQGTTLMNKGTMLSDSRLPELFERASADPIVDGPFVYRQFPPKPPAA